MPVSRRAKVYFLHQNQEDTFEEVQLREVCKCRMIRPFFGDWLEATSTALIGRHLPKIRATAPKRILTASKLQEMSTFSDLAERADSSTQSRALRIGCCLPTPLAKAFLATSTNSTLFPSASSPHEKGARVSQKCVGIGLRKRPGVIPAVRSRRCR